MRKSQKRLVMSLFIVLNEIKGKRKLTFIEIKVAMESRADLGRPKETAAENKDNFMRYHGVKG